MIDRLYLPFAILLLLSLGCGDSGRQTFQVSGSVTFNGQPVPAGYVRFVPDAEQGNAGPAARATIVDGSYQTEPGKGIVGGAFLVTVHGFDGVAFTNEEENQVVETGRPLFPPHEGQANFAASDTTHDVIIGGDR